jgi:hypothetical protein
MTKNRQRKRRKRKSKSFSVILGLDPGIHKTERWIPARPAARQASAGMTNVVGMKIKELLNKI